MIHTTNKTIDISMVPEILSWDNKEKLADVFHVKEAYVALAHQNLVKLLDSLGTEDKNANKARACLNKLSTEELNRFLYIPEISNKIFRRKNMPNTHKVQFILRALHVEIAKKEDRFNTSLYKELWAADGSVMMQYDPEDKEFSCFCAEILLEDTVVDFFSPFNRMLVDMNAPIPKEYKITTYDYEESFVMLKKIAGALKNANGYVKQYIDMMVAVIMMKKFENENAEGILSVTSSNGAYVGRIIFGNVDSYTAEDLIDAFVHEATHSLLYMVDDINQWMPTPKDSNEIGRVLKSPWTGNMLTVRTVLQAIFVWYALYKFWKLHADLFRPAYVKKRLEYIKSGFRELEIENNSHMTDLTFETIQKLRAEVISDC